MADSSLLCLVVVEWFDPRAGSVKVGRPEAPQLSYAHAVNDSISCVTLKGLGVNLNDGCRPITV
ncbi:MAG: hypothetical protein QJR10_14880 [Bacillota bacterium]|nr:hypothetical protein [Pseudacidobacterium ailaaui]MDI3256045.1 hypothetical protein [Bacillota bacterium]